MSVARASRALAAALSSFKPVLSSGLTAGSPSFSATNRRLAPALLQSRGMASDSAELPPLSDSGAAKALRTLLAHPWCPLQGKVLKEADSALHRSSDAAAKEVLEKAKAAAEAVEAFGEKLELLRLDLDELSGGKFGGEAVADLPEHVKGALLSALKRYQKYLGSFSSEEEWLRKKVQEELGAQLLQVKQRCAGLEAEWNQVTLLGTSGLSGSYIEKFSSKA